jgi:alpha-galactosidase
MSSARVTIIGAGSVVFSLGLVKDMCLTESLAGSQVCFMDINEERLDIIYQLAIRYAQDLGSDLKFEKTLDREESLQGTDFMHYPQRVLYETQARAGRQARVLLRSHGDARVPQLAAYAGLRQGRQAHLP